MDINTILPVISKVMGRDLSVEVNLFYRTRAAIGASLNKQGQEFFVKNWPQAVDFMETPEGQKAVAAFINAWAQSLIPKTMEKGPEPPPLPALSNPE